MAGKRRKAGKKQKPSAQPLNTWARFGDMAVVSERDLPAHFKNGCQFLEVRFLTVNGKLAAGIILDDATLQFAKTDDDLRTAIMALPATIRGVLASSLGIQ